MTRTSGERGVILAAAQIGQRAHTALATDGTWSIAAVFERSFHIRENSGAIVCVGDPSIGNGPLNVVLAAEPAGSWGDLGVLAGGPVARDGHLLRLAHAASVDLASATVWHHCTWPSRAAAVQFSAAVAHLRTIATAKAPQDGLAAAVLQVEAARTPIAQSLLRSAALSIATLRDWLETEADAWADMDDALESAVHRLIGLGAGLTPSGDDLLSGLLVSMFAAGHGTRADRIAHFVASAPPDATSDLSRAFLGCAIDGEPSEAMHGLLSAVIEADIAAIGPALDCLAATGHTSGWDMLAGALIGLEATAPSR